jgi:HSP20 family protein
MPIKDLIPWNRGRSDLTVRRNDEATNPFLTLHREMNRLFDDAFRGFDLGFRAWENASPAGLVGPTSR